MHCPLLGSQKRRVPFPTLELCVLRCPQASWLHTIWGRWREGLSRGSGQTHLLSRMASRLCHLCSILRDTGNANSSIQAFWRPPNSATPAFLGCANLPGVGSSQDVVWMEEQLPDCLVHSWQIRLGRDQVIAVPRSYESKHWLLFLVVHCWLKKKLKKKKKQAWNSDLWVSAAFNWKRPSKGATTTSAATKQSLPTCTRVSVLKACAGCIVLLHPQAGPHLLFFKKTKILKG